MDAAEVARYGREAFLRGDRVAVPGLMNRIMAGTAGLTPRALSLAVISRLQSKRRSGSGG